MDEMFLFPINVDPIFERNCHQTDVFKDLLTLVFPAWDVIERVEGGWPKAGTELAQYLMERFCLFDRVHHPRVIAGGLWMNYGFSHDDSLDPWEVDTSHLTIHWQEDAKLKGDPTNDCNRGSEL